MPDDEKIIGLFFERDTQGIREPDNKYGKICYGLSYNIVNSGQDAEECVNDAYLGAWNIIFAWSMIRRAGGSTAAKLCGITRRPRKSQTGFPIISNWRPKVGRLPANESAWKRMKSGPCSRP